MTIGTAVRFVVIRVVIVAAISGSIVIGNEFAPSPLDTNRRTDGEAVACGTGEPALSIHGTLKAGEGADTPEHAFAAFFAPQFPGFAHLAFGRRDVTADRVAHFVLPGKEGPRAVAVVERFNDEGVGGS